MSIIGIILFLMGDLYWYVDYQSQPHLTVNVAAMAGLVALEAAAETYCKSGCQDGALPLNSPIQGVNGKYGAFSLGGQIITYYSSNNPGDEAAVLDPALIPNVAAQSVLGRFNASTNTITGISGMSLSQNGLNIAIPPTTQALASNPGIPDQAVVMRSRL